MMSASWAKRRHAQLFVCAIVVFPLNCLCKRHEDEDGTQLSTEQWNWRRPLIPNFGDAFGGNAPANHESSHQERAKEITPDGDGNETVVAAYSSRAQQDWERRHNSFREALGSSEGNRLIFGTIGLLFFSFIGTAILSYEWSRAQPLLDVNGNPIQRPKDENVDVEPATNTATQAAGGPRSAALQGLQREKMRLIVDQCMQKHKLQHIVEGMAVCEDAIFQKQRPTDAEVLNRTQAAINSANHAAERQVLSAMAYVAPAAMQGHRVVAAMERRTQAAKQKASMMAWEEANSFWGEVQEILNVKNVDASPGLGSLSNLDVPSMATLLASAFAPAQLRTFHLTSAWKVFQLGVYLQLTMLVLLWDWHMKCESGPYSGEVHRQDIWVWYSVDAVLGGSCLVINLWCLHRLGSILKRMNDAPVVVDVDEPVLAVKMLLDYYMSTGCDALRSIDEVMHSCLYKVSTWASIFSLFWMVNATDMVFNTSWLKCATVGLAILRFRTLIFLAFLLPILVNMVLFFVTKFLGAETFQLQAIGFAEETDKFLDIKVPIVSVIVQSFLVRNRHDMANLQVRKFKLQKMQLKYKQQDAEFKLSEIDRINSFADAQTVRLKRQQAGNPLMRMAQEVEDARAAAKDAIIQNAEQAFCSFNEQAAEASRQAGEHVKNWQETGPDIMQTASDGLATLGEHAASAGSQIADAAATVHAEATAQNRITANRRWRAAGAAAALVSDTPTAAASATPAAVSTSGSSRRGSSRPRRRPQEDQNAAGSTNGGPE